MKKILITIMTLFMMFSLTSCKKKTKDYNYSYTLFNEDLAYAYGTAKDDGSKKMGYFDKKGNVVIDFKYKKATGFINSKAIVSLDEKKYFFIDKNGNQIGNETYDRLEYDYINEVYFVRNNDKEWLLDKEGNKITKEYSSISKFSAGYAIIVENWKYGYIDTKGNVVKTPTYNYASNFDSCGVAVADEKVIDTNFNVLYEAKTGVGIEFAKKDYIVIRDVLTGMRKVIDYSDKVLVDSNSNYGSTWHTENYFFFGGKVYSKNGDILLTGIKSSQFIGTCVIFELADNTFAIYDKNFKKVKELKYEEDCEIDAIVDDYYRGNCYFKMETDSKSEWYLVENGKVERQKFLDEYSGIEEIYQDYICVDGKAGYGLINLNGKVIFKDNHNYKIYATDDGYFVYKTDDGKESIVTNSKKKKLIVSKELYSICYSFHYKAN